MDQSVWLAIVDKVASAELFSDSKHFVDCCVLKPWKEVHTEWAALKAQGFPAESLQRFIKANFGEPGSDLKAVLPHGWHEAAPDWLADVQDPGLRDMAAAVHGLWKTLCRQVTPAVLEHPDRHTLLPLPYPFIIPGDRFRECYNWDSYWIIRGLLASDLLPAAQQLLRNLLHLVDAWGFVPNGARSYYTNRSQPPLLSAMVLAVWQAGPADDMGLLREALPRLVKQHRYWTSGNKVVRVRAAAAAAAADGDRDANAGREEDGGAGVDGDGGNLAGRASGRGAGEVFVLSRYHAELYSPRPESYREDLHVAAVAGVSGSAAAALYCDIASAAESGWDFSSRWFVGGDSLAATRTTQILPADLNAWLYRTERDIAAIAAHLGDTTLQQQYSALASQRLRAINTLMWSPADGCWHDLILTRSPQERSACPPVAEAASPCPAPDAASCSTPLGVGASDVTTKGTSAESPCAASATATHSLHQPVSSPSVGAEVFEVQQRPGVYASNWVPLWCGVAGGAAAIPADDADEPAGTSHDATISGSGRAAAAVAGLLASGLVQAGGLLTSLYRSGQQWDAPNAWPPLVHMAIEGLAESGVPGAPAAAASLAAAWLRANLTAWRATGHMHEKYDGYVSGGVGGGGEYAPQVGFGWSNGVLLALMKRYCATGVP